MRGGFLAAWLALLTLGPGTTGFAADPPRCVVYFKHAFETPLPRARKLAERVDAALLATKPMRLSEPLKKGGEYCPAKYEKAPENPKLRTGQKELAVIRWFGPTPRAELEFALEYFVFDRPSRRRIRSTGGFAIRSALGTEADIEEATKTVTEVVIVGPNI